MKQLIETWRAPLGRPPHGAWEWFVDWCITVAVLETGFRLDGFMGFCAAGLLLSFFAERSKPADED
jgi:hypothetical protein